MDKQDQLTTKIERPIPSQPSGQSALTASQAPREMSEVSLWLDGYDDIFSDFDTRVYSKRSVSEDFIHEAIKFTKKKYSMDKLELSLFIPTVKRIPQDEIMIKKRLKEHFKKHYLAVSKEYKNIIKKGLGFSFAGMILMITTTYILFKYPQKNFLISFLITLFEPASWFLFWEGLRFILFESKVLNTDLGFYKKMKDCEINFLSY